MSKYKDYGLQDNKTTKDAGTVGKSLCIWCNTTVATGFSMCFANFVICEDCAQSATLVENQHRWFNTEVCHKCQKKDIIGYRNDAAYSVDWYMCTDCINWAKEAFRRKHSPTSTQQFNSSIMEKQKSKQAGKGLAALLNADANPAPTLQFIKWSDIGYSPLNPRKEFDQAELDSLAESIKKLGIIQPITVRPTPAFNEATEKNNSPAFEIVCGERRYRAACAAGLDVIPASVRKLTDAEAMELMVTENLQRKDVHPLEEANAFQFMLSSMGYELGDVAAKIGKNESFVIRRLQLLQLIEELIKLFKSDDINIGHAELLSRINPEQQLAWYKNKYCSSWEGGAGTIKGLRNWLASNTEKRLATAPFGLNKPFVGEQFECEVCTACPKNSSVNNGLFPDGADEAICHNALCFNAKVESRFIEKLEEAISDPEIILLGGYYYGENAVADRLKSEGHTVLKSDDYEVVEKPDKNSFWYKDDPEKYAAAKSEWKEKIVIAKTGFVAFGQGRGETKKIILNPKKSTVDLIASDDPQKARAAFVADVNQKRSRGRELDAEKVMKQQVEHLKMLEHLQNPIEDMDGLSEVEYHALLCVAWKRAVYSTKDKIRKLLNIKDSYREFEVYEKLLNAPDHIKTFIVRSAIYNEFQSILPADLHGSVIAKVTEHWAPDKFAAINLDQEGIRDRREAKLDQKIKDFDKQHNITA